jgi:hypothetical protein
MRMSFPSIGQCHDDRYVLACSLLFSSYAHVRARLRNRGLPFPANRQPCSFGIAELWLYAAVLPCSTGSSSPSSTSGKSIAAAPAQSRRSNSSATAFLNFRQASIQ